MRSTLLSIRKHESGFTLVELAISLMVIGLLLGGVLKGQELIENARVTAPVRFMAGIDSKLDDGKPLTGQMYMQSSGLGCVNIADNTYRQNTPSTPCGRAMIQRW